MFLRMLSDSIGSTLENTIVIWAASVLNVVTMTEFQPFEYHKIQFEIDV